MRATVQSRGATDDERFQSAVELARRMSAGRYVALVADGEPGAAPADGDVAEALVTLAQALNAPTRCALVVLRGGGNRSGAEAVLTWQTGFPFAVDFAPGYPSYRPRPGAIGLLAVGELDAALVIGSPASLPEPMATGLAPLVTVAIGPRVSAASVKPAVAVDTGVAGIHAGGPPVAAGAARHRSGARAEARRRRNRAVGHGRHDPEHVHDGLPLCRPRLHDRDGSGGRSARGPACPRRARRYTDHRCRLFCAARQRRLSAAPAGGRRAGTSAPVCGVAARSHPGLRDQGREPGRGRALEVRGDRARRARDRRSGGVEQRDAAEDPGSARRRRQYAQAPAPGARPLQQPGPGRERRDDAPDDAGAGGPARALHASPVPQLRGGA